jgi:hypothetical protein
MTLIEKLEEYISNHEPLKNHQYLAMNYRDIENGKNTFTSLLQNNVEQQYIIFGSNGWGYQCFALYKAQNNNIYLFVVIMQDIETYELIENVEWFDQCGI